MVRLCTPSCGIRPESTSGGEVFEREFLTRWPDAHDIVLARHQPLPALPPHARVHRFGLGRGLRWWVAPVLVPERLMDIWAETHFDVLRIPSLRIMGVAGLLARWGIERRHNARIRLVAHHHHLDEADRPWPLERFVVRRVDRVLVGSEFARRQLTEEGFRTDHVRVVPYGVDHERFVPPPRPAARPRVVLTVSGLKTRKGLDHMVALWHEQIAPALPGWTLRIVGDGPLAAELQRSTHRGKPPATIHLSGYVPEAEKVRVYQQAAIYLSLSRREGFGQSLAEAMACGLPVVAFAGGAVPELIGDAGMVCHDHQTCAERVRALAQDAGLRALFGRAARERIERHFTWTQVLTRFTQALP